MRGALDRPARQDHDPLVSGGETLHQAPLGAEARGREEARLRHGRQGRVVLGRAEQDAGALVDRVEPRGGGIAAHHGIERTLEV